MDIDLLTRQQVLAVLGIKNTTFWLLLKDGKFPAPVLIGHCQRWNAETVKEWISAQTAKGAK